MQRYVVNCDGKPLKLYSNNPDRLVREYGNRTPLPYPKELFDKLTALPIKQVDSKGREYREIKWNGGTCVYRVHKDKQDGQYYDLVEYRKDNYCCSTRMLWSLCSAEDFIDMFLTEVPQKEIGLCVSLKEIKKLCGKPLFKWKGHSVWRDSDGYLYYGEQIFWCKHSKEEYKEMSLHRETAIFVAYRDGKGFFEHHRWFASESDWLERWNQILSENKSYETSPMFRIVKREYRKKPVEERKLIYRLRHMNIETELKTENADTVCRMFANLNYDLCHKDLCCEIVKRIEKG